MSPTQSDVRDLLIGVAGGLIVLLLVALWNIVRKVGVVGLLHIRRSVALADLKQAESLPHGALSNLALLGYLQISGMSWFAGIAAFAVFAGYTVSQLDPPTRDGAIRVLAGFMGGMLGASAFMLGRRANMILFAAVNRDAYIAELREKAGLSPERPGHHSTSKGPSS